jgi:hypothetical protein
VGKKDLADKEFQVHKQLYEQHLAEADKQRSEIKQFVHSMKGTTTNSGQQTVNSQQ